MEIFAENLKDLVSQTNLSLRQLAKVSDVSAIQYSRYISGATPTLDVVIKIAKYFDCSFDYLFGLSQIRKNKKYNSYEFDMATFISKYQMLLKQNNTSHYKFIRSQGYDESIIRHWKSGSVPRLDVIYSIAKNLGGSIDDLVGGH